MTNEPQHRLRDSRADSDMTEPATNTRNWQSVRTVMEGLILAAILWMANSMQQQATAMARLQVQVETMNAVISNVPDLSSRMTRAEVNIADLQRRQEIDEKYREHHIEATP